MHSALRSAASMRHKVIWTSSSNNIANAATTGFKESTAEFRGAVLGVADRRLSYTQIGNGVQLSQVEQQFSQGDIDTTGNNLDLALNGNGFFTVSAGRRHAIHARGFVSDQQDGFVVNSAGQYLQVYAADRQRRLQHHLADRPADLDR